MLKRKESLSSRLFFFVLHWVGKGVAWAYRTAFGRLELKHAIRRNEAFADEIRRVLKVHLAKYDGTVLPTSDKFTASFDFGIISVIFPDRSLQFVVGRGSFDVSLTTGGSRRVPVYSDACSSRDGDEIRLLERSARFLAEYWDQIPSATFQEMRAMQSAFERANA